MEKLYLVTGAVGHLASTTIQELKKYGNKIRGLILPHESATNDSLITYYKGDITKPDSMTEFFSGLENYDVTVLHMAGIVSISKKLTDFIHRVNVEGTKNVISMCLKHKVKRLLYVSSVHALPEPKKISEIREIKSFSKKKVQGAYAKTKAEATQLVVNANKTGLETVIVHPSGIIGPGDLGNNHMTQLCMMYMKHKLPCGIKGGFDFVDVRDVAKGIVLAADKGKSGECYLLTNQYLKVKELIECMRQVTCRKIHIPMCPIWIAKLAAFFSENLAKITKRRPLFTSYSLYTLQSKSRYCHDKASKDLGYKPRDIMETISDTIHFLGEKTAK